LMWAVRRALPATSTQRRDSTRATHYSCAQHATPREQAYATYRLPIDGAVLVSSNASRSCTCLSDVSNNIPYRKARAHLRWHVLSTSYPAVCSRAARYTLLLQYNWTASELVSGTTLPTMSDKMLWRSRNSSLATNLRPIIEKDQDVSCSIKRKPPRRILGPRPSYMSAIFHDVRHEHHPRRTSTGKRKALAPGWFLA